MVAPHGGVGIVVTVGCAGTTRLAVMTRPSSPLFTPDLAVLFAIGVYGLPASSAQLPSPPIAAVGIGSRWPLAVAGRSL